MGFLSPWFLAGLAAIGLPLWLHLLRQFKRTPQPFSSLMFFERRVQSSVKHRRLRYLALLSLRVALLALLALAFANPFVNRTSTVGSRRKLTVIAVDRSFSMRYGDRLQRAKALAQSIGGGVAGGDLAQVMALDAHVENLTRPDRDRGALAAAINAIAPTDSASSFGEFARALRVVDQTSGMQIEVHLVSDMQATSMPGRGGGSGAGFRDLQLGPHTTLQLHSVGAGSTPNWAVENVTTASSVYDPKKTRLTATITGWNTGAAARKVSLVLDDKVVASKEVTVPDSGKAGVEFLAFDVPYGAHHGQIRLEPHDQLPDDDTFPFAVERSDPRAVLFLYASGRAGQAYYYKAALESAADTGLTVQASPLEQADGMDFSKYAFVVLNDVGDPGAKIALALCGYVSRGGAVLVALGPNNMQVGKVPLASERIVSEGRQAQGAGFVDSQNAVLTGGGRFENVQFLETARMTPKANARVLARLANGSPLLTEEAMGEGRMLIFASTLDNSTNDFPLHASFLPFVAQTARYLSGAADTATSVVSGTAVALRRAGARDTAADVIGPDGRHELSLGDATKAASFELQNDGFYEVQRADGKRLLMAVHADRRESDLTTAPAETLELWSHTGSTSQAVPDGAQTRSAEQQIQPWSLWRYALILALAAGLTESVFATRYLREERQTA